MFRIPERFRLSSFPVVPAITSRSRESGHSRILSCGIVRGRSLLRAQLVPDHRAVAQRAGKNRNDRREGFLRPANAENLAAVFLLSDLRARAVDRLAEALPGPGRLFGRLLSTGWKPRDGGAGTAAFSHRPALEHLGRRAILPVLAVGRAACIEARVGAGRDRVARAGHAGANRVVADGPSPHGELVQHADPAGPNRDRNPARGHTARRSWQIWAG